MHDTSIVSVWWFAIRRTLLTVDLLGKHNGVVFVHYLHQSYWFVVKIGGDQGRL